MQMPQRLPSWLLTGTYAFLPLVRKRPRRRIVYMTEYWQLWIVDDLSPSCTPLITGVKTLLKAALEPSSQPCLYLRLFHGPT